MVGIVGCLILALQRHRSDESSEKTDYGAGDKR